MLKSEENQQEFTFTSAFRSLERVEITMNGQHQIENAAVSLMTLEVLRQYFALITDEEDVIRGMQLTRWPGRMEMVSSAPRLLLDGAHNAEGAEALTKAVASTYTYKKLHMMLGMLDSKNHRGVFQHILRIADTLIITEPDFIRKMDSGRLMQLAEDAKLTTGRQVNLIVEPDWRKALQRLQELTEPEDLAVVTGTLYLISDVRSSVHHQAETEKGW
jgi:dihydrofolate synthase/folylpolyglutamate synthase